MRKETCIYKRKLNTAHRDNRVCSEFGSALSLDKLQGTSTAKRRSPFLTTTERMDNHGNVVLQKRRSKKDSSACYLLRESGATDAAVAGRAALAGEPILYVSMNFRIF